MTLPLKLPKIFLICWCTFLSNFLPTVLPPSGLYMTSLALLQFHSPRPLLSLLLLAGAPAPCYFFSPWVHSALFLLAAAPAGRCSCSLQLLLAVAPVHWSSCLLHLLLVTAPAQRCSCLLLLVLTAEAAHCCSFSLLLLLMSASLCCCSSLLPLCLAPILLRVVWICHCRGIWFPNKSI